MPATPFSPGGTANGARKCLRWNMTGRLPPAAPSKTADRDGRWPSRRARLNKRLRGAKALSSFRSKRERGLHRPARLDGLATCVELDVGPAHHRAVGDVILQFD